MTQTQPDFSNLTVAERIQLADDLWDSVAAEGSGAATLPDAQLEELQALPGAHDADPSSAVPWEKVRGEFCMVSST